LVNVARAATGHRRAEHQQHPDSRPLSESDRRLIAASDRLAYGRSETTDGALTVTNLCAEARVSRASH